MTWLTLPKSLAEWNSRAPQIRAKLWALVGDLPPFFTPNVETLGIYPRRGFTLHHIVFDNGADARVYGYLLIPNGLKSPAPAVLYHHYHGGQYKLGKSEALLDRGTFPAPAFGLVEAGFIVFAIDAYGFGERLTDTPTGESGTAGEMALFKHFLWRGQTLWGMMLRDDCLALNWIASRDDVDPARIGATGMSLGGSRSTWLAALDERIKVAIPIAQMTRYADFHDYNRHGIYYYLPAILKNGLDMELLTALTAPRRQLILIGDQDPLSPLAGVQKIQQFTEHVYDLHDAKAHFQTIIYKDIAHQFTPTMYHAMLDRFQSYL